MRKRGYCAQSARKSSRIHCLRITLIQNKITAFFHTILFPKVLKIILFCLLLYLSYTWIYYDTQRGETYVKKLNCTQYIPYPSPWIANNKRKSYSVIKVSWIRLCISAFQIRRRNNMQGKKFLQFKMNCKKKCPGGLSNSTQHYHCLFMSYIHILQVIRY